MSSVAVPSPLSPLPRPSAAELRRLVEAELADRIPGALSPREPVPPEMASSGIVALDALTGGWPRGTLSELFGPASSGRTSVLLAALAATTARGEACALIDAGDAFDPESAVAAGVDLKKLLWVRCGGKTPPQRHRDTENDNFNGSHPERGRRSDRVEGSLLFAKKFSDCHHEDARASEGSAVQFGSSAVRQFQNAFPEPRDIGIWGYGDTETMERINPALARTDHSTRRHEDTKTLSNSLRAVPIPRLPDSPTARSTFVSSCFHGVKKYRAAYARIEQAIKAADLLLAGGGFGLVAIDLAGLPPEAARRIPLTTWFRLRRGVESLPAVLLLVSPQPLTQSCAALALKLQPSTASRQQSAKTFSDCHPRDAAACEGSAFPSHAQLLTGFRLRAEVVRSPLAGRKRPQSAYAEIVTQAQWA